MELSTPLDAFFRIAIINPLNQGAKLTSRDGTNHYFGGCATDQRFLLEY
jgi:hypothetical protein